MSAAGSPVDRYRHLRSSSSSGIGGRAREEDPGSFSELELQSFWFSGAFGRRFRSSCGRDIFIRQFGHWNHAAGPDFTDAAILVDHAEEHRGAIELDRDSRDWERHGHSENPAYENVMLHLFFNTGSERHFTRTASHRNVLQVQLSLDACEDLDEHVPPPAEARPGRCSYTFAKMPPRRVIAFLQAAAQYRLDLKARRYRRVAEIHGESQALFEAMATALGYRHNAFPMHVISQRAPIRTLRGFPAEKIEAILLGLGGFLDGARHVESTSMETIDYQRNLWSIWWRERGDWSHDRHPRLPWRLAGTRPTNHPQRRLAALARIAAQWPKFQRLANTHPLSPKACARFLGDLTHPYWDFHYTLKAARAKRSMALVGKSRAWDILANVLFPMHYGEHPKTTWDTYRTLPALLDNEKVRRAGIRLFAHHPDRARFTKRLYQQQALLQVYDDFCLVDTSECEECPFPEQLWAWETDEDPG